MTTALFIGRFQPFHLGHLSVVQQALKENDFLIIGIGSSQYSHARDNPFTFEERKTMITAALDEAKISRARYTLLALPDIHDDAQWVDHVISLVPQFDRVYTGSPIVKKLFKKHKDHAKFPVVDVEFLPDISATTIRKKMKKGEHWETDVPDAIAKWIMDKAPSKPTPTLKI